MPEDSKMPPAMLWYRLFGNVNPFRWIFLLILLVAGFSAWEFSHRGIKEVDLILDPGLNFTETISEIYPDRGFSLYQKAKQTSECFNQYRDGLEIPDVCRKYHGQDMIKVVKESYSKGIESGFKNGEELYYEYLHFLILTKASKSEIDAAYTAWRELFPLSRERDPFTRKPRED